MTIENGDDDVAPPHARSGTDRHPGVEAHGSNGGVHAIVARQLDAARGIAIDALTVLNEAGMTYPASFARAACGNLDRATASLQVLASYEMDEDDGDPAHGIEHLTLTDGRRLGIHSRIRSCGTLTDRGAIQPNGEFDASVRRSPPVTQTASRDLGWDLVASRVAREFARDDVSAALLRRALPSVTWFHLPTRARWLTSRAAAATTVRLMRDGSPAPALAPWRVPEPLDAQVAEMIGALDWAPLTDGMIRRVKGRPAAARTLN